MFKLNNRRGQVASVSTRSKVLGPTPSRKLGVESLETRLSLATGTSLSAFEAYYVAWYQANIVGPTAPNANTNVPTTGPLVDVNNGPKNLQAIASPNARSIALSWTAPATAVSSITLERSTDSTNFATIKTLTGSTTSFTDTAVLEGQTYTYRLRVTGSALATTQTTVSAVILNASGLAAAPQSDGSVALSWADNSNVNTGYFVERSTDGKTFTRVGTVSGTATSYTDATTAKGTTYYFRLITETAAGTLTPTAPVQVTTVAPPPPVVTTPAQQANKLLQVTFDKGLERVVYNGAVLIDMAQGIGDGTYYEQGVGVKQPNGSVVFVPFKPLSLTWDASTLTLTRVYDYGTTVTKFSTHDDMIDIETTYTNTTPYTITGTKGVAASFRFPKVPVGYNGDPMLALTQRSEIAVTADFGVGKATIVATRPATQEMFGWLGHGGQNPTNPNYRVRLQTTSFVDDTYYGNYSNPVTTGQSIVTQTSIRFSPPGTNTVNIAPDAAAKLNEVKPYDLNWSDRRPIATIFPAGGESKGKSAVNPSGWFNDPNLDLTTTAGLEDFRARMLALANQQAAALVANNAQGMISWEIEGTRYPTASFIGDPRTISWIAPELEYKGLIDDYHKAFTSRGLKVGFTLRLGELKWVPSGLTQVSPADAYQNLYDKIKYAKDRWGATIFYLDSVEAKFPDVIERLHKAFPDSLLIPEHNTAATYAVSAGYKELRSGVIETAPEVRAVYPQAFSAIWVNDADTQWTTLRSQLVQGVKSGDLLLVHWWMADWANGVYKEAHGL